MNQQGGQGYPPQQPGQPSYPPMNSQLSHQSYQVPPPQSPSGYAGPISQGQVPQPYPPTISTPRSQSSAGIMAPPHNSGPQSNGSQGSVQQQRPTEPEKLSKEIDGKKYTLEVVQEPVRARMCGFGDKDRRPITPPPCVRLIITDVKTGQELDASDFDTNFFILTVDLWDETSMKEVNLVRHSATSPSISAATSSSYPPPSNPVYPFSANTAAAVSAHSQAAAAATGMQVHVGLTAPGYGPSSYGSHHAAPHMAQPPPSAPGQPQPPPVPYHPQDPSGQASRAMEAQSYYVSPTGQPTGAAQYQGAYGGQPGMHGGYGAPGGMPNMLPPSHAAPMDPRSAPSGMFTRNLIGSLAVNSNPLTDTHGKLGIWFILQDLSVRTEGTFRLKMQFCNVADPVDKNTLNRGTAPILASVFSAPFHVYSAKKFPGVIESTPLSKCFAMQGVKIPIRKDGPTGKAAEVDDDAGS